MDAQNKSSIRQAVRQILRDEFDVDTATDLAWEDDELDVHIGEVVREVSRRRPRMIKEVKTTIANSKIIDYSDIEDLLYIDRAEYPTGEDPRANRNVIILDEGQLEIDTTLTPIAGGSGTLTGAVTFTSGSAAVTGSGTAFSTELKAGYHIKKAVSGSSGRWYRIYSITNDTHLTLAEPVASDDNGADTVSITQYCYETAYLFCAKVHTLTEESSTLTPQLEEVLVKGVAASAALAWVNQMRKHFKDASDLISTINTAIGNMSARVTQATADLTSGREQIDDVRATADTAIDNVNARVTQALADLTSGRALINTVPVGGAPQTDYVNYATRELQAASEYLSQARGYLSEASSANKFGDYAARELQSANAYLNQAGGYIRELSSLLNVGSTIRGYLNSANTLYALYEKGLSEITQTRVSRTYPKD
jgi:hypothetical protein